MIDELEHQENPSQGKAEHSCMQVSVTDLKQLPAQTRPNIVPEATRRLSVSILKRRMKEGNMNGREAMRRPV